MFLGGKKSSMKQMAYAKRMLGGQGDSKKQIALNSGYSPQVANSVKSHIEDKAGFNHAMSALALESNNLALSALHEFKARGFKEFTNKELVGALNAIGSAWSKFNAQPKEKDPSASGNKLRTIVLNQIENQTNNEAPKVKEKVKEVVEVEDVSEPLDF